METVFGVSVACPAIVASNADTGLSPVGGLRHQSLMGRLLRSGVCQSRGQEPERVCVCQGEGSKES